MVTYDKADAFDKSMLYCCLMNMEGPMMSLPFFTPRL